MTKAEWIEALAEIEHEQWIGWSKDIAFSERLSFARMDKWQKLWVRYGDLPESEKDKDRKEAEKVYALLRTFLSSPII